MLKIRLQGTVRDIRWFKRLLEKHPEIRVIQVSEIFSNKGTNRYWKNDNVCKFRYRAGKSREKGTSG